MDVCQPKKTVGAQIVLEIAYGCSDTLPLESEWERLGSMRTKESGIEWDTADATDDSSVGALRETIATFKTFTISGDGTSTIEGGQGSVVTGLHLHQANPVATGGQPTVWMRITYPDITYVAYMLVSSMTRPAPYDDVVTWSMEATATASPFGLIVERTPSPDAPPASAVQVVPATLTLNVGAAFNIEGIALPANASQQLRWSSSDAAVASVNPITGVVVGRIAGTASITATSVDTPAQSASTAVTVVPQVLSITVSPTTVTVADGSTQALTAAVAPSGAASGLTYTSQNTAVATVSSVGLVTGVSEGTTSIKIASVARPSVSVNVPVTVTA